MLNKEPWTRILLFQKQSPRGVLQTGVLQLYAADLEKKTHAEVQLQ